MQYNQQEFGVTMGVAGRGRGRHMVLPAWMKNPSLANVSSANNLLPNSSATNMISNNTNVSSLTSFSGVSSSFVSTNSDNFISSFSQPAVASSVQITSFSSPSENKRKNTFLPSADTSNLYYNKKEFKKVESLSRSYNEASGDNSLRGAAGGLSSSYRLKNEKDLKLKDYNSGRNYFESNRYKRYSSASSSSSHRQYNRGINNLNRSSDRYNKSYNKAYKRRRSHSTSSSSLGCTSHYKNKKDTSSYRKDKDGRGQVEERRKEARKRNTTDRGRFRRDYSSSSSYDARRRRRRRSSSYDSYYRRSKRVANKEDRYKHRGRGKEARKEKRRVTSSSSSSSLSSSSEDCGRRYNYKKSCKTQEEDSLKRKEETRKDCDRFANRASLPTTDSQDSVAFDPSLSKEKQQKEDKKETSEISNNEEKEKVLKEKQTEEEELEEDESSQKIKRKVIIEKDEKQNCQNQSQEDKEECKKEKEHEDTDESDKLDNDVVYPSAAILVDRLLELRNIPIEMRYKHRDKFQSCFALNEDNNEFYAEDKNGNPLDYKTLEKEIFLKGPSKVEVTKRLYLEHNSNHSFCLDFTEDENFCITFFECRNGKIVRLYAFKDKEGLAKRKKKISLEELKNNSKIYKQIFKYAVKKGLPENAESHFYDFVNNPTIIE